MATLPLSHQLRIKPHRPETARRLIITLGFPLRQPKPIVTRSIILSSTLREETTRPLVRSSELGAEFGVLLSKFLYGGVEIEWRGLLGAWFLVLVFCLFFGILSNETLVRGVKSNLSSLELCFSLVQAGFALFQRGFRCFYSLLSPGLVRLIRKVFA